MKPRTSASSAVSEAASPFSTRSPQRSALSLALAPLLRWYEAAGVAPPAVHILAGETMPEPYRSLLVHERDMTSTLETFHRGTLQLRVLGTQHREPIYQRVVVLELEESGRAVEFGATHLHLDALPPAARSLVLAAKRPFGAILRTCAIAYVSRPKAFFRVEPDATIANALRIATPTTLYGRCNALCAPAGNVIADIVEILPPAGTTVSSPGPT
ncbi:hypothetical protein [Horticoccus sp. 23ND18S-11]|uniref:hypothetical protein n=1 Tax=Horticoccus sp. 23ND18S-11 TaxID=3391832 RepID=UPI0039C9198D